MSKSIFKKKYWYCANAGCFQMTPSSPQHGKMSQALIFHDKLLLPSEKLQYTPHNCLQSRTQKQYLFYLSIKIVLDIFHIICWRQQHTHAISVFTSYVYFSVCDLLYRLHMPKALHHRTDKENALHAVETCSKL